VVRFSRIDLSVGIFVKTAAIGRTESASCSRAEIVWLDVETCNSSEPVGLGSGEEYRSGSGSGLFALAGIVASDAKGLALLMAGHLFFCFSGLRENDVFYFLGESFVVSPCNHIVVVVPDLVNRHASF